jgi:hydrogenase maturation factor
MSPDAEKRFDVGTLETREPAECISGQILRGLKKRDDCPAFTAISNDCDFAKAFGDQLFARSAQ